jgi:hypothetical protein
VPSASLSTPCRARSAAANPSSGFVLPRHSGSAHDGLGLSVGWDWVGGGGALGLAWVSLPRCRGKDEGSDEWVTGREREKGCVPLRFGSLGGGILDVICRCSASADSGSQERGAPKFTQPNRPASRIWLPEASVFGAAPSWSDGKLEAGGIPNTP